jgi:hypothetical protein
MKIISDDDFEFVFGDTPPTQGSNTQPTYGPNLPPEGLPQPIKSKIKPLDLNNPVDYQIALDAVLQEIEDQKNAAEATRLQADKELGRPSSPYISEQDILNCIEKGKLKDTPERLAAIEKEINDPNSPERGEFYKKLFG